MAKRIVIVLVVGGMAASSNTYMFGLLLTSISEDLGQSISLVGGMKTISALTSMTGAIMLTRVADRLVRKWLMLAGFTLAFSGALVAVTATTLAQFIVYFIITGLADVILFSTLLVAASDYTTGRDIERTNGFVIGSFGLSGFLIAPLGGVISQIASWRYAYLLPALMALIAFLLVLLVLPRVEPSQRTTSTSFRAQLRVLAGHAGLIWIVLSNMMRFVLLSMLIVYSAAFVINRYDLSDAGAGIYVGIAAAAGIFISFSSGFVIERLGIRRVLISGGYVIAATIVLGMTPHWALIIAGACLVTAAGLLAIQENAALGSLIRLAGPDRGSATALNEFGAGIGMITGTGVSALVIQFAGFSGLGLFAGLIALAALAFTSVALRSIPWSTQIMVEAVSD